MKNTCVAMTTLALTGWASAAIYSGAGFQIPDNAAAGATSVISVSGEMASVATIEVSLLGLTHTRIGDLNATLSSPDGTEFPLFIRVGKTSDVGLGRLTNLGGDYRFTDRVTDSLWVMAMVLGTNVAMPSGDYRTSAAMSPDATSLNRAFAGEECNGNWAIRISDNAGGEVGRLLGWELSIVVPGPSTLGLAGVAALTASRRRR